MSRSILFLICLNFVSSCRRDVSVYEGRDLFFENIRHGELADSVITCVTYNIHLGFTSMQDPWDKDQVGGTYDHLLQLKKVLMRINPDVICLQEVPKNRYNVKVKDFIRSLAAEMRMNVAFGAHGYNDPSGIVPVNGEWGNAVLSKFEILEIANTELEYRSVWERRSAISAKLKLNDTTHVMAYSMHFLPSPAAVPASVKLLLDQAAFSQLVMGDFNMTKIPEYMDHGYSDVFSQDSVLSSAIDRIYVTKERFKVRSTGTVEGSAGISDHVPNYCTLSFR